jgi:hypothetical protein
MIATLFLIYIADGLPARVVDAPQSTLRPDIAKERGVIRKYSIRCSETKTSILGKSLTIRTIDILGGGG